MLTSLMFLGFHVVPYVGRVEEVLTRVLSIHNRDGHIQAVTILRNLLSSLTTTGMAEKNRLVTHRSNLSSSKTSKVNLEICDLTWSKQG